MHSLIKNTCKTHAEKIKVESVWKNPSYNQGTLFLQTFAGACVYVLAINAMKLIYCMLLKG